MIESISASQKIALSLYQAIFVALSLWLGVARYVLKQYDKMDIDELEIMSAIAGGFLILSYALLELGNYLLNTTTVGAIDSAVFAVEVFLLLIGSNIIWMFLRRSFSYEANVYNFVKVLVGSTVILTILSFATHLN